jgi:nucleoside-diphosphate-sugar epimerase
LTDSQRLHDLVDKTRPDIIYHLASCSLGGQDVQFVLPNFESDLRTTVNILLAAHASGCKRTILIASLEEPVLDGRPIKLSSSYAAAKVCGTFYGLLFNQIFGVSVTIVRPFMVYGPRQKAYKIIPYAIQSQLRGDSPRLSSGTRTVDWVYVEDVITAFIEAAIRPEAAGKIIDLGSGKLVSVRDAIEEIHRQIPGSPAPGFGALPDRMQEVVRCADTEMAWRILGWRASTSLTEGMARTIEHYQRQAAKQCTPA